MPIHPPMVDLLGCPHDHPRRQCARESARPGSSALLLMGQQQTFHPNMSSKKNIPIISHMIDICADVIYNIYIYPMIPYLSWGCYKIPWGNLPWLDMSPILIILPAEKNETVRGSSRVKPLVAAELNSVAEKSTFFAA